MATYIVERNTAETVTLLAQAAEHFANGAAALYAGGQVAGGGVDLKKAAAACAEVAKSLLDESRIETVGSSEAEDTEPEEPEAPIG